MERIRWPLLTLAGLITLGSLIVLPTVAGFLAALYLALTEHFV